MTEMFWKPVSLSKTVILLKPSAGLCPLCYTEPLSLKDMVFYDTKVADTVAEDVVRLQ